MGDVETGNAHKEPGVVLQASQPTAGGGMKPGGVPVVGVDGALPVVIPAGTTGPGGVILKDITSPREIVHTARGGNHSSSIGLKKPENFFHWVRSFFVTEYNIPEEELEEYRMLSSLEPAEICRLRVYFDEAVGGAGNLMDKDMFLSIPFVASNPLKDRLVLCFGYDDATNTTSMDFVAWLQGVALFNSHGKKEEKLKLAFKIQDFDGDNQISKQDLTDYLKIVTDDKLDEPMIKDLVEEVFRESCSDPKMQHLSFQDFSRVMAPTDFHIKLILPF